MFISLLYRSQRLLVVVPAKDLENLLISRRADEPQQVEQQAVHVSMSFREKIFIDQLHKDAKITLSRLLSKRRSVFWGETPILFRIRKYKVAGEVRSQ